MAPLGRHEWLAADACRNNARPTRRCVSSVAVAVAVAAAIAAAIAAAVAAAVAAAIAAAVDVAVAVAVAVNVGVAVAFVSVAAVADCVGRGVGASATTRVSAWQLAGRRAKILGGEGLTCLGVRG